MKGFDVPRHVISVHDKGLRSIFGDSWSETAIDLSNYDELQSRRLLVL